MKTLCDTLDDDGSDKKPTEGDKSKINHIKDLIEYFRKQYSSKMRRLCSEESLRYDSGLYQKLLEAGKLDQVIPSKQKTRSTINPIEYFKKHYSQIKSRAELMREDKGLYDILRKNDLLDVLPAR